MQLPGFNISKKARQNCGTQNIVIKPAGSQGQDIFEQKD